MNYQESREYIDKITREIPSVLGLEHMRELMKRLGNPQDDLKYVHVAGTNGKGSVIAFLYSALSGAGYRIGRYVSPTLYSYRGRMEVSGSRISREDFAAYITQVSDVIAAMTKDGYPHPTAFEIETAVAFLFLKKRIVISFCWKWEWAEIWTPQILLKIRCWQCWYRSVWIICLFLEILWHRSQRRKPGSSKTAAEW